VRAFGLDVSLGSAAEAFSGQFPFTSLRFSGFCEFSKSEFAFLARKQ
jgi:hypothetical protein